MGKFFINKNNGLKSCLKNGQTVETPNLQRDFNDHWNLTTDLSTDIVDKIRLEFLTHHAQALTESFITR